MSIDINNPYFRTKVLTASPEELRLMLIEGCIRFMQTAREGLVEKNFEKSFENFTNAKSILVELTNTLRHDVAPELCTRLDALYTYMYTTLTYASMERDPAKVDPVIELMDFERETWLLLMDKLAAERAGGVRNVQETSASESAGAHTNESSARAIRAPLSVQG